jgi:hypothetical protein
MAILTWKQTVLNHIKNLVIRMGDCYMVIYFDNGETLTIDPNNKIKEPKGSNKKSVCARKRANVNQEEYDESDDEEELFK